MIAVHQLQTNDPIEKLLTKVISSPSTSSKLQNEKVREHKSQDFQAKSITISCLNYDLVEHVIGRRISKQRFRLWTLLFHNLEP